MADKRAEDEEDDIFGDFTFASTHNSNQTNTEMDDDWGDFVTTTSPKQDLFANSHQFQPSNAFSTTQNINNAFGFPQSLGALYSSSNHTTKPIESQPSSHTFEFPQNFDPLGVTTKSFESKLSNTFDPAGVWSNETRKPLEPKSKSNSFEFSNNFDPFVSNGVESNSGKNSNSNLDSASVVQKSWEKPKGALPLSIFGDEDEEEEEEEKEESDVADHQLSNGVQGVQGLFPSKSLPTIKNRLNMRSTASFSDIIINLYGQKAPLNRSISNIGELSNGDIHQIKVENCSKLDVIEDMYGKTEEIKLENGSELNAIEDSYGKKKNKLINAEQGSKLNAFEDLYEKSEHIKVENVSKLNAVEDLFGRNEQIKVENGSNWNLVKTEQVKVENRFNSNLIQEKGDLDEDEWEFKDATWEKSGKDGDFGVKEDDNVLASWEIQTDIPPQVSTKIAMTGTPPNPNEGKIQESTEGSLFGFSNTAQLDGDWFVTPENNSYSPTVIDNGFHSESGASTANIWDPDSLCQPNHIATENGTDTDLFNGSFGSDESFGDFKDASPTEPSNSTSEKKEELKIADQEDVGMKEQPVKDEFQGNGKAPENERGALPLSVFSDGKVDSDEQLFDQDMFSFKSTTLRNAFNSQLPSSNLALNDLIKDLYSQAENIPAVGSTSEHTANEFIPPQTENGFISPQTGINPNLADAEDDFDETSWEFRAAFTETKDENSRSVVGLGHTPQNISSESRITSFMDFYSRLKEEAAFIILHHLDGLKNAKKAAALSGDDAKVVVLHQEIQTAYNKLLDENMVPRDDYLKEYTPRGISVNELLAAMDGANFRMIESEYRLSQRISLAEQNLSSAVRLFEHAISVVKILNLGTGDDISNYTTTWSRMTSVCARELKHGASIWKQSLEKNVHTQMLSKPQGKRYIIALGEMYRVAEVLRVSATFYKPWILSSLPDPMDIFATLEECRVVWSNFGINEALQSISDTADIGYDGSIKMLLESIKSIHDLIDLDVLLLQNTVSLPEETCRLSLLSLKMVPDMKMVLWNGEHYFLKLANFWVNLISSDPPKLPHISVY